MSSGEQLLAIAIAGGFTISIMFKSGLKLWFKLIIFSLHLFKWLWIVGLLTAFLNMPQFYETFGFTPMSILVDIFESEPNAGARFYEEVKNPKLRKTNDRDKVSKI